MAEFESGIPTSITWKAELFGVNPNLLNDVREFCDRSRLVALNLGLTIVEEDWHHWLPATEHRTPGEGDGISLLYYLAQSHWASHSWPEYQWMDVHIALCDPTIDLSRLEGLLGEAFDPAETQIGPMVLAPGVHRKSWVKRGNLLVPPPQTLESTPSQIALPSEVRNTYS